MNCNHIEFRSYDFQRIMLLFIILFVFPGVVFSDVENAKEFMVFDALLYTDKPNTADVGMKSVLLLNHVHLWEKTEDRKSVPSHKKLISALTVKSQAELLVINVEHWKLRGKDLESSKTKYKETMELAKKNAGGMRLGLYSMFPARDYWATQKSKDSKEYREWQKENNDLGIIVKDADVIMPSLYTFYADREGWVRYAVETIAESRRLYPDKPVYVFLWPQYHVSSRFYSGKYLPGDFWRLQLETAYKYADGIVVWGGWDDEKRRRIWWDGTQEWWSEMISFMQWLQNR